MILSLLLACILGADALAGGGFGAVSSKRKKLPEHSVLVDSASVDFVAWLSANGAELGAELVDQGGGRRGLVATADIEADAVVAAVPSAICIGLSDPAEAVDRDVVEAGVNLLNWYLGEAGADKAAFFAPYLATLPRCDDAARYTPTPDAWTEAELASTEWAPLVEVATKRRLRVAELAEREGLEVAELQFATWLASSRALAIKLDGNAAPSVFEENEQTTFLGRGSSSRTLRLLVPLLDSVNWSARPNCAIKILNAEQDDATFALVATRAVRQGEELCASYPGAYGSAALLRDYGFAPSRWMDGSSQADARALSKQDPTGKQIEWTATLAADRAQLAQLTDPTAPAAQALTLKINLRATRTNPKHTGLFKGAFARASGAAPPVRKGGAKPPPADSKMRQKPMAAK